MSSAHITEVPAVVVGGVEWEPGVNYPSNQTVRELARNRPVLYIYSEARGNVGDRLRALRRSTPLELVRTAVSLQPRPAEERLWVAPFQGLSTLMPLGFPEPLRRHNVCLCRGAIREWLEGIGASHCLLICYWWFVPELVTAVPSVVSIYDCTDEHADYPGSSLQERTVRRVEARLLDAVDCSFLVSPALLPPRQAPGRRMSVLPNAFDTETFAEVVGEGLAVPEPLRSVTGPVVGCIGALGGRADTHLVQEIVRRRPDWTFAFIGADARNVLPEIVRLPNVMLLGELPYREALKAMARFDAGIIPFRTRAFTRGNSFLKLLDHFAHGTPVVATPLPDTIAVARADEELIRLAEGPEEWLAALMAALHEPATSSMRGARRRYVQQRSVERRVERMLTDALEARAAS